MILYLNPYYICTTDVFFIWLHLLNGWPITLYPLDFPNHILKETALSNHDKIKQKEVLCMQLEQSSEYQIFFSHKAKHFLCIFIQLIME